MLCGFRCSFMASPLGAFLRDGFDGIDNRLIAGAAAIVPRQMFADGITAWGPAARKQFLCSQQHRWCAETALQRVPLAEGVLQVRDGASVRYTLDGFDVGAVALHRERETAAHNRVVDSHRAGAGDGMLATHV